MSSSVTNIAQLPEDIWRCISDWILFYEVGRLYLCGNTLLNAVLARGGARTVVMKFAENTEKLFWPSLVAQFTKLSHFEYNSGAVSSSAVYFPCKSELMQLGPALECLILKADGAENAFFAMSGGRGTKPESYNDDATPNASFPLDPDGPIELGKHWPRLHTLAISQFSSYRYKLARFGVNNPVLPSTLTKLSISFAKPFSVAKGSLPDCLLYLELPSSDFTVEQLSWLPSGLLALEFDEVHYELPYEDWKMPKFTEITPKLEFLSFSPAPAAACILANLPSSLRRLETHYTDVGYRWMQALSTTHQLSLDVFKCSLSEKFSPTLELGRALSLRTKCLICSHSVHRWDVEKQAWLVEPPK